MAGCQNCISCGLYTLPNDALAVKLQQAAATNGVSGSTGGGLACDSSDPSTNAIQSGLYVVVDGVTTYLETGTVKSKNKRLGLSRTNTATQSIPDATVTTVTVANFGTITENTDFAFSTAVNMSNPSKTGVYALMFRAVFSGSFVATGSCFTRFTAAGVAYDVPWGSIAAGIATTTLVLPFNVANTVVDVAIFQTSGAARTLAVGSTFNMHKLSE